MPEKETLERARKAKRQGKSASTQAGEFIREEIHHVREGKHGARSTEQAIAIGLSKARRAGVPLKPPKRGQASKETREAAAHDYREGQSGHTHHPSPGRSRAMREKLKREPRSTVSHRALSEHAQEVAKRRGPAARHESAMKAVHSRTHAERSASARKAARTRARNSGSRRTAARH
jgi:hypothetical protein